MTYLPRWIFDIELPNAIRKWEFIAEDFDEECIALEGDVFFVGTTGEAENRCQQLEERYENKHGFLSKVTMISHGIMWQGLGKDGGLA